jgi:hypothetical protein
MKACRVFLFSAVVATAFSISTANAVTTIPFGGPSTPVGSGSFALQPDDVVSGAAYLQDWFFNISAATTVSANAGVTQSSIAFTPLNLSIFSDGGALGVSDAGDALVTDAFTSSVGGFQANLLNILLASPGSYYVQVDSGGNLATKSGLVTGNIDLSPVPIPGALPLFATGLVGLLALGRRKRKVKQELAA